MVYGWRIIIGKHILWKEVSHCGNITFEMFSKRCNAPSVYQSSSCHDVILVHTAYILETANTAYSILGVDCTYLLWSTLL